MINFNIDGVQIDVELDNGYYEFIGLDYTGKSWLCRLLKSGNKQGLPVAGYDYKDFKAGVDMATVLNEKHKLIVLDRYTMYLGEGIELIKRIKDKAVIIADVKSEKNYGIFGEMQLIEIEKNRIRLFSAY